MHVRIGGLVRRATGIERQHLALTAWTVCALKSNARRPPASLEKCTFVDKSLQYTLVQCTQEMQSFTASRPRARGMQPRDSGGHQAASGLGSVGLSPHRASKWRLHVTYSLVLSRTVLNDFWRRMPLLRASAKEKRAKGPSRSLV
ncbi:uncharacterized protein K489DRAFT_245602 [Dissoconium aciculare CBS 342.82]|uniref:Uncharacterized protein n=1 Tax=Dissoconium aciculare CBS 342.82 TaxID=1314786 RepID=A0A6J3M3D9_9PEZI|nr:uncharacterized protein K489DRAFT_245602 [Dissoconium aciculare CBS 342.82]KAF1822515.1 hypothetical protein K489DRAFT_245602 [Dissoconium aciculare CBS 342.82]